MTVATQAHPEQVIGIAAVDLHRPMDTVRELRRCVRNFGINGVRFLPWPRDLSQDDPRYQPLYAECITLDVTVCLQVGHARPMRPSEPGRPMPHPDHVAHEFSDLRIVGGHIGFPLVNERISLMMKHPNGYMDTSTYMASRAPQN